MNPTSTLECDSSPYTAVVDRGLRFYIVLIVLLAAIGVSVVAVKRYLLHRDFPQNTLLYDPTIRFTDFTSSAMRVRHFGDPEMLSSREFGGKGYEVFPYPVPAVYPHLFYNQFAHPLRVYLATVIAAALLAAIIFGMKLRSLSGSSKLPYLVILVTLLTPFPLFYLIERGNLEGFIWILILGGVFLFYKRIYHGSAMVLAVAAAMKIFPALLFLLFIAKRKYSAFGTAVLTAATVTVLSWWGVGPTLKQAATASSASGGMLKDLYIVGFRPFEIGWDHSLMAAVKQFLYIVSRFRHVNYPKDVLYFPVPGVETAAAVYGVLAPLAFVVLYWKRLYSLPVLNQLIAFILLSVMLPFVSNEYTLVHVYIAWGAFVLFLYQDVRTGRVPIQLWRLVSMLGCFAIIFSPQSYWVFGSVDTLGGQIKTAAMVTLLALVFTFPMPSSGLGELESQREDA